MKLLVVIGTRPNFIKVTRFREVMKAAGMGEMTLVHTGQHYDRAMSGVFFEQFGLQPDHVLQLKGNSGGEQFANMLQQLVALMEQLRPDLVLVPGDVNSTLAGALAAQRLGIPVGHLEAGLRSFDRGMPEEINRILVDQLASHHFVTEHSGETHLVKEGLGNVTAGGSLHFVGNTMIDTLVHFEEAIERSAILDELGLTGGQPFYLLTMHRPATVDGEAGLAFIAELLEHLVQRSTVVFPIHPRTRKNMERFGWSGRLEHPNVLLTPPLDYFAFQKLVSRATSVITDSGGLQEETTYRQVPCVTLRPNTERPITIEIGTNQLVPDFDVPAVLQAIDRRKLGDIPRLWDGHATERVVEVLSNL